MDENQSLSKKICNELVINMFCRGCFGLHGGDNEVYCRILLEKAKHIYLMIKSNMFK